MKETSLPDSSKDTGPQLLESLQHMVTTAAGRAHMLRQVDGFITHSGGTRENLQKTRRLIRDGYVPVLYANHQSHADKLVLSDVTQSLVEHDTDDKLSEFLVPVAATIESGAQGAYIQQLMTLFEPLYRDRKFGPDVPFITDNDRQVRGIEGSNTESVKRLMDAPRDKHGLVIFPEGSLKGGRLGEDGAVNGLQEVTSTTGSGLIGYPKFWLKRKLGEAVFVPVGISGSYRVYPPGATISQEVLISIVEGTHIDPLVTISAGSPFTYNDLREEVNGEPDHKQKNHLDLLMSKVAEILPAPERGHYDA